MKQKLKSLFLNDLVKISSWTGVATIVRIASQFVISKILAIFAGPAGIAIMGQLTNVGNIVQTAGTGGITIGVTKYISEHSANYEEQRRVINTAFKVIFFCSLACTGAMVLAYKFIGHYIFKSDKYNNIILLLGVTLILFSFNNLFISIINGLKQFRLYVIINICTSVVNLLLTLFFVHYWGVFGALLAFVLSPALVFFLSYFLIYKYAWLSFDFLFIKFDYKIVKNFGRFSLMLINNAVIGSVAQLIIRSIITKNLSINFAGIWDGMNRISSAYLLLLTTSIQVYYLPMLSSIKSPQLLWKEIIKTQKIILPLVFLLFVVIFFLRGIITEVLFTKEFFLMNRLFIFQLVGDMIKIASWILSYTMYAKAMTKQLIITDNIFTATLVLMIYFFIGRFGLNAIYYAYIINNTIYLVFMYFFLKNYILSRSANV